MGSLLIVILGFVAAVILSEVVLGESKLQTGLGKVVLVHGGVASLLLVYFLSIGRIGPTAIGIFWAGAFLSWFGVRSHAESSILLRMLSLLGRAGRSEAELLKEYESHYGPSLRLQELFRGRLIEQTSAGIVLTSKGKWILRIASWLK